jgi:hypothetical protein
LHLYLLLYGFYCADIQSKKKGLTMLILQTIIKPNIVTVWHEVDNANHCVMTFRRGELSGVWIEYDALDNPTNNAYNTIDEIKQRIKEIST